MNKKLLLPVLFIVAVLFSVPTFAATKKSLKLPVKFQGTGGEELDDDGWNERTYVVDILETTTMKLKSPLKFGGMLYISKSIFKNGGYLNIAFDILLYDSKDGELFEYGDIKNRDWICIGKEKASDKDIGISLIDENTGKTTEAPKGVTVKSSGNYYIISFKNIRSSSVYTKYGEVDNIENQKFVTNKAFYPQIALIFHGDFPKTASGNILVDYIAVTGAKTIKSSFEKHDFYNVVARRSTWAKVLPTIVQTPG